jgi:hypothetical protein
LKNAWLLGWLDIGRFPHMLTYSVSIAATAAGTSVVPIKAAVRGHAKMEKERAPRRILR